MAWGELLERFRAGKGGKSVLLHLIQSENQYVMIHHVIFLTISESNSEIVRNMMLYGF